MYTINSSHRFNTDDHDCRWLLITHNNGGVEKHLSVLSVIVRLVWIVCWVTVLCHGIIDFENILVDVLFLFGGFGFLFGAVGLVYKVDALVLSYVVSYSVY